MFYTEHNITKSPKRKGVDLLAIYKCDRSSLKSGLPFKQSSNTSCEGLQPGTLSFKSSP